TAMQFEISDAAAIAFCRGFYAAIGRGRGVDEAVRSGRVSILGLGDGCLEWITPTLYLRGRETHLFDLTQAPEPPVVIDPVLPLAPPPAPEPLWADELVPAAPPVLPAGLEYPDVPAYPDRFDDLWAVAKRIGWTERPLKSETRTLALSIA